MKLTQLAERKCSHVIAYGDPKSGKTTLGADLLLEGFKLLWVSIDNGHEILLKDKYAPYRDNVDIIVLPDTKDFPVAIDTCLKLVSGAKISICDAHGQVNCSMCRRNNGPFSEYQLNTTPLDTIVVFDHLSQCADSAMNFICKGKEDTYKPEWDDFRIQGTLMNKLLTNIQQANFNVLCFAHCVETEMENGAKKLVPQIGTVPFSRNAGKYFDHMVYCEVMNKKHNFGSATTYKISALTGSRKDVKIEDQKDAPSLAPFFNGVAAKEAAAVEEKKAVEVLASVAATTALTTPAPTIQKQPVVNGGQGLSTAEKLAKLKGIK